MGGEKKKTRLLSFSHGPGPIGFKKKNKKIKVIEFYLKKIILIILKC